MTDTNLSLVLHGKQDLKLEDRSIPEPGPGEVQLSIQSVGICGSDLAFWKNGAMGSLVLTSPTVMGHEPSGIVTKLGQGVTDFKIGDRVAVEPSKPCCRCSLCKAGHYNLCPKLEYLCSPPTNGAITRWFCHPAHFTHKIPDNMSFDEAALVQPLSVALHACQRGNVSAGSAVLVTGAGPLGMSIVLAAKAMGASKICVTEINKYRLDYIKTIGADVTVAIDETDSPKDMASKVVSSLGREPDVTLECSGNPQATSTAIYATKATGTVVQLGFPKNEVNEFPTLLIPFKELNFLGSMSILNTYESAIEVIASGQVNVQQLITHRFPLEQAIEAIATSFRGEGVKIIIDCSRPKPQQEENRNN